jgi:hypothetical protein
LGKASQRQGVKRDGWDPALASLSRADLLGQ